MKNHSNLSAASKAFGKIATEQNNPAAAAMAIHLAIASAEAYAAELEERQRQAETLHHLIRLPYGRFTVFIGTLPEAQADCRNRDDWDCIGSAKIIRSFTSAVECNEYLFEELGV